jgi:hypothetical protein
MFYSETATYIYVRPPPNQRKNTAIFFQPKIVTKAGLELNSVLLLMPGI